MEVFFGLTGIVKGKKKITGKHFGGIGILSTNRNITEKKKWLKEKVDCYEEKKNTFGNWNFLLGWKFFPTARIFYYLKKVEDCEEKGIVVVL